MIDEELPLSLRQAQGGGSALQSLVHEDLSPYSVEDLASRIVTLEAEIKRVRDTLDNKKNRLSEASALFSFKGS
ncbi:hypothetical protein ABI_25490 [Asticcacaulis biprosthecium C19]|uniref:DUF1192 domain-containing protein n=1 Tax=Asticcacaulis biprosthecium C19 TaxID=715226 RepID=F4QP77_9CAUL|nr:DUF1192 domain-containing protein [Asticcacaulis biprosthecium]EGF91135.1 hypothetical protein ABI_25490 [Asticcacaulis biprosthecium C19]